MKRTALLDGDKILQCCWSCKHPGNRRVFYGAPSVYIVDPGKF